MKRRGLLVPLAIVVLVVTAFAGLAIGSVRLPLGLVVDLLTGSASGDAAHDAARTILFDLRMPRVAMAFIVGSGLSIVGVAMQALVRNPLAEPYILGLSSGAGAGASMFYLGFLPPLVSITFTLPLAAFAGGLATILVVYAVARDTDGVSVTRLLLAGVAMSALMASVTSFVTFASPDPYRLRAVLFWLLGSLTGSRWETLVVPATVTALSFVVLVGMSRPLDALLLGEEPARALGIPVEGLKKGLIVLAALLTGSLVAFSGAIGFVGLIVPHAVRSLVGVSHRRVLPFAFLGGGLFLVWADLLARSLVEGQDLPVGIFTAMAGVPFFLLLLRRHRYPFG